MYAECREGKEWRLIYGSDRGQDALTLTRTYRHRNGILTTLVKGFCAYHILQHYVTQKYTSRGQMIPINKRLFNVIQILPTNGVVLRNRISLLQAHAHTNTDKIQTPSHKRKHSHPPTSKELIKKKNMLYSV